MPPFSRRNWAAQPWVLLTEHDMLVERRQCHDEGKDITALEPEFAALALLDLNVEEHQQRAEALLDAIQELPTAPDYAYLEPSDLPGILAARPAAISLPSCQLTEAQLTDKALGAWQGRVTGCLLGKPVEGKRSGQLERYLKAQGRWPLDGYFSGDASSEAREAMGFSDWHAPMLAEHITQMPVDDDTNYTVAGLAMVKQQRELTPEAVAMFWMTNFPAYCLCTAERVAYKNLLAQIPPPQSARHRNVYREWIGAQIRADAFGYVNPGNPERAAAFAWADAAISHVKNGIYGEMWVAAMLAAAYVCDDVETVIRAGLAQVPAQSRFTAGIERILACRHAGMSYDEVVADLRTRWDETNPHDWCHTISNAEIVAIGLLWGEQDFARSICYSVMPGFDTDCNGATTGSVVGLLLGANALPAKWIAPWNDTLLTDVKGYHRVRVTDMAAATVGVIKTMGENIEA